MIIVKTDKNATETYLYHDLVGSDRVLVENVYGELEERSLDSCLESESGVSLKVYLIEHNLEKDDKR